MKKKRLSEVERELGKPLSEVIPQLVNEGGQKHAAQHIGVSQFSICDWLLRNGYERVVRYEKREHAS